MVVGQSVGTAATSAALGAVGSVLAHIIFSVVVGVLGMLLLHLLAKAATWAVSGLDDYDGVFALAAFSRLFKPMGIFVFFLGWIALRSSSSNCPARERTQPLADCSQPLRKRAAP